MDIEIREFVAYLHNIKKMSANTEVSYQRDLKKMAEFCFLFYFKKCGIYQGFF